MFLACQIQQCPEEEYLCKDSNVLLAVNSTVVKKTFRTHKVLANKCIDKVKICDGIKDCPTGDDEFGCTNITCASGRFQCQSHTNMTTCIPDNWVCDGRHDCLDGSDESNCPGKNDIKCHKDHFACRGEKICISTSFICDGLNDCSDGSDEVNCKCNNETHFCCDHNGDFSKVLPKYNVCDGRTQCSDKSDEANCKKDTAEESPLLNGNGTVVECGARQFKCHDGFQCIKKESECDGKNDCDDGSDEDHCTSSYYSEKCNPAKYFTCKRSWGSSLCFSYEDVCDWWRSCIDFDCSKTNSRFSLYIVF